MSALEKFREHESLVDDYGHVKAALLHMPGATDDGMYIHITCEIIDVKEARALRDWLNKVLPT